MMFYYYTYFLLIVYIAIYSSAFAYVAIMIPIDTWTAVFLTSTVGLFFILESMELNKLLQSKDVEIHGMKEAFQDTLLFRTNELTLEIKQMKKRSFTLKRSSMR